MRLQHLTIQAVGGSPSGRQLGHLNMTEVFAGNFIGL